MPGWLSQLAALTLKEFKLLARDRQALALLFLMPTFFILVMSFALEGVFESGTRSRPLEILVVNQDRGEAARSTIELTKNLEGIALVETGPKGVLTREDAESAIRNGTHHFALVFGKNYSERIGGDAVVDGDQESSSAHDVDVLGLIMDPAINQQLQTMVMGTVSGLVERVRLATQLPARLDEALGPMDDDIPPPTLGDPADAAMGDLAGDIEDLISDDAARIEPQRLSPKGYRQDRRPTATEQNVPAYAIFGVFFIVLTIAKSFLRERVDGTFLRLLASPLPKGLLIAGKLLPYYIINLLQILMMFTVGVAVFGMHIGNLPAFVLVSLATAATANGLGLLVAAFGRSEAQVDTLAVLLAISLAALGGVMVPTFVMPSTLQQVSRMTPHAWALAGYQDVIVRGLGVADVLKDVAVLGGFAVVFWLIGLWRLRLN